MTTNHFALHIGLSRAENLYQIKKGNNGISKRLAAMICEVFPEINYTWLLEGSGQMLFERLPESEPIPYYEVDVEANVAKRESIDPTCNTLLPNGVKADFAMVYRGAAMGHAVPPNTHLYLEEIPVEAIIPGGEYLITTASWAMVRVVRQEAELAARGVVRLAAVAEGYDDIFVEKRSIESAYKIKAKLIINY